VISEVCDSWRSKALRLSQKLCPSRGDDGTRALVDSRGRWDQSSPPFDESTTHRGARIAHFTRRGTFVSAVLRHQAAREKVLHSGLSGPRNPALAFNGHRRKRWSDRGVARKRRHDRASVSEVGISVRACIASRVGSGGIVAARSVRGLSSTGESRRVLKSVARSERKGLGLPANTAGQARQTASGRVVPGSPGTPRKVRAPQGRVVGNADPG